MGSFFSALQSGRTSGANGLARPRNGLVRKVLIRCQLFPRFRLAGPAPHCDGACFNRGVGALGSAVGAVGPAAPSGAHEEHFMNNVVWWVGAVVVVLGIPG